MLAHTGKAINSIRARKRYDDFIEQMPPETRRIFRNRIFTILNDMMDQGIELTPRLMDEAVEVVTTLPVNVCATVPLKITVPVPGVNVELLVQMPPSVKFRIHIILMNK